MSGAGQKQSVASYEVVEDGEGRFALCRDGAAMRSPAGSNFVVPTRVLAEAIAQEWRAQKPNKVDPASMPMTQLAVSALDGPMAARDDVADALLAFARSDALLHRAPAHEALAARQAQVWQPLLDWFAERFGARLVAGEGLMPLAQSDEAMGAVKAALARFDPFALAGIGQVCRLTGSLVLSLAMATQRLNADQVFEAAELEALSQIERWGVDSEARARLDGIKRDIEQCAGWFDALAR